MKERHFCFNSIDVRFRGRDDFEGVLWCTVCGEEREGAELREEMAAYYAEPDVVAEAA